jgi:hypothetical protein
MPAASAKEKTITMILTETTLKLYFMSFASNPGDAYIFAKL